MQKKFSIELSESIYRQFSALTQKTNWDTEQHIHYALNNYLDYLQEMQVDISVFEKVNQDASNHEPERGDYG